MEQPHGIKRQHGEGISSDITSFLKTPFKSSGKWADRTPSNPLSTAYTDEVQLVLAPGIGDDFGALHNWLKRTANTETDRATIAEPRFEGTCDSSQFFMTREKQLEQELQNAVVYLDHRHDRMQGIESYLLRKLQSALENHTILKNECDRLMTLEMMKPAEERNNSVWKKKDTCKESEDEIQKIRLAITYIKRTQNEFSASVLSHLHAHNINPDASNTTPTTVTDADINQRFVELHKLLAEDNEMLLKSNEMEVFRRLLTRDQGEMARRRMETHNKLNSNGKKRRGKLRQGMKEVPRDKSLMVWGDAPAQWKKTREKLVPTGWVCPNTECRGKAWVLDQKNGTLICKLCGIEVASNMTPGELNYKQRTSTFKHVSHFQKRMSEMQGNESPELVPNVYCNLVITEAKNHGIEEPTDPKQLTAEHVLYYLQIHRHTLEWLDPATKTMTKIKTPSMYEHVNHIRARITGEKSPQLTANQALQLTSMFLECLRPFLETMSKVIPGRKNLIRYPDILYHQLELHRWNHFLPFVRSVNWDCQKEQERVWKEVCRLRNYPYIGRGVKD